MKKKILLMIALLCAVVQGAWADAGDSADDPITISSESDWNTFASNVSGGNDYSGKFVKLTQSISVTQKVGVVSVYTPEKAFSGTFDGGGKTITATITDNSNQGTALFCYINGATIKNLNLAGIREAKIGRASCRERV